MSRIIVILIIGLLCGCSKGVDQKQLVGSYELKYTYGNEVLILKDDGTYSQLFGKTTQKLELVNQDKWKIGKGDFWDGQLLELDGPVVVDDGFGKFSSTKKWGSALWSLRIRKHFRGKYYFLVNEDLQYSFERRD